MAASLDNVMVVTKLRDRKGSILQSGFSSLSFGTVAAGQPSEIKIIDMEVLEADLIGNVKIGAVSADTGSSNISETLFISTADTIAELPEPYIPFPAISSGSASDPANLPVGQRSDLASRYVAIKAVAPRNPNGAVRVCLKWFFDFGLKPVADNSSSSSMSSVTVSESEPPTRKMLSIAINSYSDHYNNLTGSHNSMAMWEALLVAKYGFSVEERLLDSSATRSEILAGIHALVNQSAYGDVLAIGFAGQAILLGGSDAILAYDSPILYSEISSIIDGLPDGVKMIMISEAPFSGTRSRSFKEILLAATMSGQAAATSDFQDAPSSPVGAFTYYATGILTKEPGMTYRKFLSEIKKVLPQEDFDLFQSPQVECEEQDIDTPVFSPVQ